MFDLSPLVTALTLAGAFWIGPTAQAPAPVSRPGVQTVTIADVTVECDTEGNWIRIYSTGTAPVEPPTPRGVTAAQDLAGRRATAQITKFFEQDASKEEQIVSTLERAIGRIGSGGEAMTDDARHRLATSISQLILAYVRGTLKEARFSAPGYDSGKGLAWVRIGLRSARVLADGAVVGGVVGALGGAPPPPASRVPVRVTGDIKPPTQTKRVPPVYPAIAQAAGVEGVVVVEATIDADGKVTNATVVQSIPLLDQAAVDAVRQWEFTPTLLNGAAVPVVMTVSVRFSLR